MKNKLKNFAERFFRKFCHRQKAKSETFMGQGWALEHYGGFTVYLPEMVKDYLKIANISLMHFFKDENGDIIIRKFCAERHKDA